MIRGSKRWRKCRTLLLLLCSGSVFTRYTAAEVESAESCDEWLWSGNWARNTDFRGAEAQLISMVMQQDTKIYNIYRMVLWRRTLKIALLLLRKLLIVQKKMNLRWPCGSQSGRRKGFWQFRLELSYYCLQWFWFYYQILQLVKNYSKFCQNFCVLTVDLLFSSIVIRVFVRVIIFLFYCSALLKKVLVKVSWCCLPLVSYKAG